MSVARSVADRRFILLFAVLAQSWGKVPDSSKTTILIDPGHGGDRPSGSAEERTLSSPNNAKTPSGLLEKDLALELSKEISRSLQRKGFNVVLTRTDDSNPDFGKRALIANHVRPSAIVSVHFNASEDHSALGTLTMLSAEDRNPNYAKDLEFAKGVIEAVSGAVSHFVPESKPRAVISDQHLHGGLGSNFFHQLSKFSELRDTPKCFLEVEFIDRSDVDRQLIARRKEAFPQIADALADYLTDFFFEKTVPEKN